MAAGSLTGGASRPASSSGPSADADDTYYDPTGGNDSFLSTRSIGHSSTMSVDSFASAQSADKVTVVPGALCQQSALRHPVCHDACVGCPTQDPSALSCNILRLSPLPRLGDRLADIHCAGAFHGSVAA